jgi:hypothetical protein
VANIVIEIRGGVIQAVLADPALAKREDIVAEIIDFDDIEDGYGTACGREYDSADVETDDGESVYRKSGYIEVSLVGCVGRRLTLTSTRCLSDRLLTFQMSQFWCGVRPA